MSKTAPPRILFVCLGNICRSPSAEGVMRSLVPDWTLDSAGTAGWHSGKPPYGPMQQEAARRGYDLSLLRARQAVSEDFHRFDYIIAMDEENLADLQDIAPKDGGAQLACLMSFAPEAKTSAVPDPYYTRDFAAALDLIETGCQALLKSVLRDG